MKNAPRSSEARPEETPRAGSHALVPRAVDPHREPFEAPDRIEHGLYLGSFGSASHREPLEALGVRAIVTVAKGLEPLFPGAFQYTVVEVLDFANQDLLQHLDTCFDAIDRGREAGGVLVHCAAGVSRSGAVVIAYIMRLHSITCAKAMAYVRRCRPKVNPNRGFLRQLMIFEAKLVESGALPASDAETEEDKTLRV